MELIRPDINIDFVGKRHIAIGVSWLLILIGIVSLVAKGGPHYGIDFSGGTLVQAKLASTTGTAELRDALHGLDLKGMTIQQVGDRGDEFLIRVQESSDKLENFATRIQSVLEQRYGSGQVEIRRTEMVGPQVGQDLRGKAMLAVIYAIIGMLVYITFRFELRFGVGAVIALVHDVLITLGVFSVLNLEIDLTIIAAFLTIVGYSVNDTVIVCDRIRDNLGKHSNQKLGWIINRSINETLSRTVMTSGITLLSVVAMYVFGGEVIRNFSFALLIGIIVGTYSSIYVAAPVILYWESYRVSRKAA